MSNPVTIVLGVEGANAIGSALEGVAARLASVAGVVVTVHKALEGMTEAVELGGRLKNLSVQTGETAGQLVVLRRAFEGANLAADSLSQYAGILQRSLSGINEDGAPTAATFQRLGLSMGRLREQDLATQLSTIGEAIRQLPTPAERTAAAMQIFGRSGQQLLPLLLDGGAFSQARDAAGGLADAMDRNAVAFDRVGNKAGDLRVKLTEAYAVISERMLPTVERVVDLLNSVSGASLANGLSRALEIGLTIGGYAGLQKVLGRGNTLFLDWATRPGAMLANSLGETLFKFTGSLAKILPVGLAAAVALEIGVGLYQAQQDAANRRGQTIADAAATIYPLRQQLESVRSNDEAAKLQAAVDQRKAELDKQRADLAAKDKLASQQSLFQGSRTFGDKERAQLDAVDAELHSLRAINVVLADRDRMEKIIAANRKADADAEAKQQASAKAAKERFELETQLLAAQTRRDQPEVDRLQRLIEEKKIKQDLREIEKDGVATAGLADDRLKARDAAIAKERSDQRAAFDLATQQQQAEIAANIAEQNRVALVAKEKALREELKALGAAAEPLIQARLKAEKEILDKQAAQAALQPELVLAQSQLERISQARTLISQSQLVDEATKLQRLTANTEEYRAALAKVIELKLQEYAIATTAAERAQLRAELEALRAQAKSYGAGDIPVSKIQSVRNQYADRNLPSNSFQSTGEAIEGARMEFITGIGTEANNVAAAITGTLNGALQGTSDLLYGLSTGAINFRQAWGQATLWVGQQFLKMATDMVARMIWRATAERGLLAITTALHVGSEATKTAATAAGSETRLGHIVVEALAAVYHGAVEAFSAMASIPYVGPFVAAAAMAAALAGGIALVNKIGKRALGGSARAGEPLIVGDGGRPEVFVPGSDGHIFPSITAFASLANSAAANLAARGAAVSSAANASQAVRTAPAAAPQTPAPDSSRENPRPVNIGIGLDLNELRREMYGREGDQYFIDAFGRTRHLLGV